MTWASVGTSFPLGLAIPPAPEGREWFVFCMKDVGLCKVQPSPETWTTICWLNGQDNEGREWGGSAYVIVLSTSSKPLLCDLEAS